MMDKTKLLWFAVIALLLLNFGTLAFLFLSKKHEPFDRKMPREIIIEKLHFTENQIVAYDKIIKQHQETIKKIDDSIRNTKNNLYQLLNDETINTAKKDSLFSKLAKYQTEIETTHFNHFLEIKKLCNKEQLQDYKNLTQELGLLFSQHRKPRNE